MSKWHLQPGTALAGVLSIGLLVATPAAFSADLRSSDTIPRGGVTRGEAPPQEGDVKTKGEPRRSDQALQNNAAEARSKARAKGADDEAKKGTADDKDDESDKRPIDQGALLQTQSAVGQVKVKSWKTLRDAGIVKQDLDYSCGAASSATLLNSFYGQKVSEKAFLKAMGEEDGMASFEDMAKAMPKFGFKAKGFAASWDQLLKLKIPVIVYVKYRKDDHFSVLRGISGDTVWLADPSLGSRTFSKEQFLDMWQTREDKRAPELAGKFLAVLPAKADINATENYFSKSPRRQTAAAVGQQVFRQSP